MDGQIGSSGTIVAAALMTAGQYLQSQFLDLFDGRINSSYGTFLFLCAAISGVFTFALYGRARYLMWGIVSPALFFYLMTARTHSAGAIWEFGSSEYDQRRVKESLRGIYGLDADRSATPAAAANIRVSTFYALWDEITGSIVKAFVTVINRSEIKTEAKFLVQSDRFLSLFNLQSTDPNVQLFLHTVLFAKCVDYFTLQQSAYSLNETIDPSAIAARLAEVRAKIVIPPGDSTAMGTIRTVARLGYFGSPAPAEPAQGYTCDNLWSMAVQVIRTEAVSKALDLAGQDLAPGVTAKDMIQELARKFDDNGTADPEDTMRMYNAIVARMLFQAKKYQDPSFAQLDYNTQIRTSVTTMDSLGKSDTAPSEDIQAFSSYQEYRGKGEFLSFILGLPYLQGLALYFLSLTFPVFAMLMLLPGRMTVLLTWMQLWAWIRCWDIGFAVVMLTDEVLYYLLPNGPAMTDSNLAEPGQAFKLILEADPTYNADTYYMMVASLLASIPVLSGLLVTRGGRQFMGLMSQAYEGFAGQIGGSFAAYSSSMQTQRHLGAIERYKFAEAMNARVQLSDPEIQAALASAGVGGAMKSAFGDKGVLAKYLNSTTEEGERYGTQLFEKKLQALVGYRSWQASASPRVSRLQSLATMKGFSIHEATDRPPLKESAELIAARKDYRWGGAMDSSLRGRVMDLGQRFIGGLVGLGANQLQGESPVTNAQPIVVPQPVPESYLSPAQLKARAEAQSVKK